METVTDLLKCQICKDLPEKALEASCCPGVYCELCSKSIKNCSICLKPLSFLISLKLRKIIDEVPENCKGCGQQYLHKDMVKHKSSCPNAIISCKICLKSIQTKDLAIHISEDHAEIILSNLFQSTQTDSLLGKKISGSGKVARLGSTGKYYCGGPLDYPCGCCAGVCGPESGCNCTPCLRLDLNMRLLSSGFYVNKSGNICKSTSIGIYCGCKLPEGVSSCGPENGPRCDSCKSFQKNYRFIQEKLNKNK
jgi:hypothetical protein